MLREIVWAGTITRYQNPGSFEYRVVLRIVRVDQRLVVERMSRDAMSVESWQTETDVENVTLAFTAWVNKHA